MDIFKDLKLKPKKTEPNVWISRLAIFERIAPDPVTIRDIKLIRGLNIIWAEETEDDDPSAEISGHSAGKTTFCRFVRYVLGEKTYGTRANTELIQNAFPSGYIAAEIHVKGKKWGVLRPIGKGRNSYIKEDAAVEDILQDRSRPAYVETYTELLGLDGLLDDLGTGAGAFVRAGEPIQWGHVLSWCTRDQESRFQNIHEWRSPRSESETPAFRSSKADPLFMMRTVLGLFLPDELKGEENLVTLKQNYDSLEKEYEKLKREPQYWINRLDSELRKCLQDLLPDERQISEMPLHSGNLLPDLSLLTKNATEKVETEIALLKKEETANQEKIDFYGGKILQLEARLKILDNTFNVEKAAVLELDASLSKNQKNVDAFDEYSDQTCSLGGVLYRDCGHVKRRRNLFEIKQHQDAKVIKQKQEQRVEAQQNLDLQKQHIQREIDAHKTERHKYHVKRTDIQSDIQGRQGRLRELGQKYEGLETGYTKRDQAGANKELDECRKKQENTASQIKELEQRLTKLLAGHNESRDLLAAIFSASVKAVLASGTYDGKVSLDKRELAFSITHGPAMTGEAVETLSVLLTDIASLIYNTVSDNACMPGFLLHDSPREADLGLRIYKSFIRFVASLQEHFGGPTDCPFQYVLTTTTAPPKELQIKRYVKQKLNAVKSSEMLLGRNIGVVDASAIRSLPL